MRILLALLVATVLAQASSPLELSITDLALPKLTVVVKNNDPKRTLGVWAPWTSWGDDAWHFEFRDRNGKTSESKRTMATYLSNGPSTQSLGPETQQSIKFDLSGQGWHHPGINFDKLEGVSVRVVLHQRLEVYGHVQSLFTGEVTSPWTDLTQTHGEGTCVEWSAVPTRPDGKAFDLDGLLKKLDSLKSPKSDSSTTLLDWLGAEWAWDQAGIIANNYRSSDHQRFVTLLFDHANAVTLCWNTKKGLNDAQCAQLAKGLELKPFGDGKGGEPGWAVASAVLSKVPAAGIAHIDVWFAGDIPDTYSWQCQADGSYRKESTLKEIK